MNARFAKKWPRWEWWVLAALVFYPPVCGLWRSAVAGVDPSFGDELGDQLSTLFVYGILALALNVAVGYSGLLQLGIAGFFGIGVYITGIFTVDAYPFQVGFAAAMVLATLGTAMFGVMLGAPTLRLRGEYLAIVTLGFAEVVKATLKNLTEITKGTQGLEIIPSPQLPAWLLAALAQVGVQPNWRLDYRLFYYLSLVVLVAVVLLMRTLERSRLGLAWIALREDELAASCMGINVNRAKLASFAFSAALAGLAGCLYATKLKSTSDPNAYDFSRSIIMLCCVILGGLGSMRGTLLGVFLLLGFDSIVSPRLDSWLQAQGSPVQLSDWRYLIFGLALILMMRFRPEGLLPSVRLQHELHPEQPKC